MSNDDARFDSTTILGIIEKACVRYFEEYTTLGAQWPEGRLREIAHKAALDGVSQCATQDIVGLVNKEMEERTREVIRALAAVMVTDHISGLKP